MQVTVEPGTLIRIVVTWQKALTHPRELLAGGFQPSDPQISDGLTFLLAMLVVTAALNAPLALKQKGDFSDKLQAGLNGLFGLISSAILIMAWHFPFVWLGGKASFAGTYLAYCYGSGPYLPITAFATLVYAAGLPSRALKLAISPVTARQALAIAKDHPETSTPAMALGGCSMFCITMVSTFVTFRNLSFAHSLTGGRLVIAVLLSLIASIPISMIFLRIAKLFLISADDQVDKVSAPKSPTPDSDTLTFCFNCGQKLHPGAKFCAHCGTRTDD